MGSSTMGLLALPILITGHEAVAEGRVAVPPETLLERLPGIVIPAVVGAIVRDAGFSIFVPPRRRVAGTVPRIGALLLLLPPLVAIAWTAVIVEVIAR